MIACCRMADPPSGFEFVSLSNGGQNEASGKVEAGSRSAGDGVFVDCSLLAARAQTLKGTILGTITDISHAVIPGVQVLITEVNTNFHRTETTNDSGFYVFANLDPGSYRVEVEHMGVRKVVRAGIALVPNTTVRVDLELSPGEVSDVIDVSAETPLLQTDRADGRRPAKSLAGRTRGYVCRPRHSVLALAVTL